LNEKTRFAMPAAGVAVLAVVALTGCGSSSNQAAPVTSQSHALGGAAQTQSTGSTKQSGQSKQGSSAGSTATSGAGRQGNGGAAAGSTAPAGGTTPPNIVGGNGTADASKGTRPLLTTKALTIIKLVKGERVQLRARSQVNDVMHIFGYEYNVKLPAGKTIAYSFKAKRDGDFLIEFVNQAVNVGELRISP
jgi:hypothetical protein